MLGRVLTARDRWLKAGGLVIPSQATLYMAPVALTDGYRKRVNCWTDVFGIDMSTVIPLVKAHTCDKPFLEEIKAKDLIALPQVVKHVDCYTINAEELKSVSSEFKFSFFTSR